MKKLYYAVAVAAMFLFITALLLTSFQIAVYGDRKYRFYEKEYEKYHVTDALSMEMGDVMEVTEYMMAYLIGEEEELSIETKVDGRTQDFFNEQDRIHMADVRNLFLGGLQVRNVCLMLAAALLIVCLFAQGADLKRVIPRAYLVSLCVFVSATVILGILFASDFTKYFTIFHEIFFTNDLWIFDEATDYMIRMLPEGFFYDMAARIGLVFLGLLLLFGVGFLIWGYGDKRWKYSQKE